VITFGLGFVLAVALGMVAGTIGWSLAELNDVALLLNIVLAAVVSFVVLYIILRHDFRAFRIRLMRVPSV
jgi:sulfite exporter TauE/SafE